MKTNLTLEIEYDAKVTDPEALAYALDRLLETALSTPGVLEEYGNPACGEFLVAESPTDTARRFVLYDFDQRELANRRVYADHVEAVGDASELSDVIVLALNLPLHNEPATPVEEDDGTCDCEQPGFFCSGVPGILAHLEGGRLADGSAVERCDLCRRYPTDEAALERLIELGIAQRRSGGGSCPRGHTVRCD